MIQQMPQPGGAGTRQRLIQSALDLFGRYGYEGVTTRALAKAAGTNVAAMPYHFGGKRGIYMAVAEHVVETLGKEMRAVVDEAFEGGEPPRDPKTATAALKVLLTGWTTIIVRNPELSAYATFLVREQVHPGAAFPMLYERHLLPIHAAVSRLVALIFNDRPDSPRTLFRAQAMLGMVLVFATNRQVLLRRLNVTDEYPPEAGDEICETISGMVERLAAGEARQ